MGQQVAIERCVPNNGCEPELGAKCDEVVHIHFVNDTLHDGEDADGLFLAVAQKTHELVFGSSNRCDLRIPSIQKHLDDVFASRSGGTDDENSVLNSGGR